jgi:hypothetical protein
VSWTPAQMVAETHRLVEEIGTGRLLQAVEQAWCMTRSFKRLESILRRRDKKRQRRYQHQKRKQ